MAHWEKISAEFVGSLEAKKSLLFGTCEVEERVHHPSRYFYHQQAQGIYGLQPKHGYSGVFVPGEYRLYSCILCFIPAMCVIYNKLCVAFRFSISVEFLENSFQYSNCTDL